MSLDSGELSEEGGKAKRQHRNVKMEGLEEEDRKQESGGEKGEEKEKGKRERRRKDMVGRRCGKGKDKQEGQRRD